jgi:hypothetical protein
MRVWLHYGGSIWCELRARLLEMYGKPQSIGLGMWESRLIMGGYQFIAMPVSFLAIKLLFLLSLILPLPQTLPRAPPHLLQYRTSRQQLWEHYHYVFFTLDHNHQVESDLESLEGLMYEEILDTRGGYEARSRRLEVRGGRCGGLNTEAAKDSQRLLCCNISSCGKTSCKGDVPV